MSTIILIILILATLVFLKLQSGDNPKIPPASSRKGKKTRIVAGVLFIAIVSAIVVNTMGGGVFGTESSRLMIQTFIIAVVVVLIPLLVRWNKDKGE